MFISMKAQILAGEIRNGLEGVSELYNRLLLVVGSTSSGKTAALRALSDDEGYPVVNVGIDLGRRLLDLTERQRVIELPTLLEQMVAEVQGDCVILDDTEILFDPALKQDPLRLLKAISRNRTIIASWLGSLDSQYLMYAIPGHREFRRYPLGELLIVALPVINGEPLGRQR